MYKNVVKSWTKHLDFTILDIVCLEIAFFIAYVIRHGFPTHGFTDSYENVIWAIVLIDICMVFFGNAYGEIIRRGYLQEIKKVIIHTTGIIVGMIIWMFVVKQSSDYSRTVIILMYPISAGIMIVARLAWKRVIRIRLSERKGYRKLLLVTTESRRQVIVDQLLQPYRDYELKAVVIYDNENTAVEQIYGIPVVGGQEALLTYIKDNVVDEVFIDLKDCENEEEPLTRTLVSMGLPVHINLSQFTMGFGAKEIHTFGPCTVLSSSMKFVTPKDVFIKRVIDICGAIVGLIITGIACIFVAPIIHKQSPGPIFFAQNRVGRNGRTFKIYKFRTMYLDAEERKKELMKQNKMKGLMFKMDNDPRIYPFGHYLRKSSIDELPQFWNVLKGDMSLVGTRPPTLDEYNQYEARHRKRLAMKPGITGMWQVSGRSDIVDFEEVVELDAKYITEWSLGLDIKIIWRTVLIVLGGKGAV